MLNSGIFGGYCERIRPDLADNRLSKYLFGGISRPGRGGGRGPPNDQKHDRNKITKNVTICLRFSTTSEP